MDLDIEYDDRAVIAALNRLARRAEDPRPALTSIGEAILERVQHGFEDSQDPYGQAWRPLKHRAGKPLMRTGLHMLGKIVSKVSADCSPHTRG
jgi:phage gpG-like protein